MSLLTADDLSAANRVSGFMIEALCMTSGGGDRGITYITLSRLDWDDLDSDIFCGNVTF